MSIEHTYTPRYIRFEEVWEISGLRLKVYGISQAAEGPGPALFAAARSIARARIKEAAPFGRPSAGFVGVHAGRDMHLVFVDWWDRENELFHHAYLAPLETPDALRPAGPGELTACVWDIALICFERAAWIESILDAAEPDLDRYVAMHFNALI